MTSRAEMDGLRARFEGVAQTLGRQLAASSPRFVALAAKWTKEDLVPGLSDMDFRIVCDDRTTANDWAHIDQCVGRIHLQMVSEHPKWNRINEHTAGAGVSLAEFRPRLFHHPEHSVWSVWFGPDDWLVDLKRRTLDRPMTAFDEHYHLSRFLTYYSPYIHGIDPPINLGEFEPKYALHSRCWHYFAPPMLSAATLLAEKHFEGKRAGLLWLAENGFAAPQALAVLEQVDAHYDTPEQQEPRRLEQFERFLFQAFEQLLEPVRESIRCFELPAAAPRQELQAFLRSNLVDPLGELLELVRFARIRAGRYFFYLNAPAHFSATRQLQGEQLWTRKLASSTFEAVAAIRGVVPMSAVEFLTELGLALDEAELDALDFMSVLAKKQHDDPQLRKNYAEAIEKYPDYYRLLERMWELLQKQEVVRGETARTVQSSGGLAAGAGR
jgi:hypothetical protein